MAQQIKTCKRKTQDDEFYTMYKDAVHCGWISTIKDDWKENKVLNNLEDVDYELTWKQGYNK